MNQNISPVRPSFIEPLESRVAPAGLITATFAVGMLTITGDTADNVASIFALGQDSYLLQGDGGTLIALNGAAPAASVNLNGPISSIKATMDAGNDGLTMTNVTVGGALTFDGGAGNDSLALTVPQIKGALNFLGGGDNDVFSASGTFAQFSGAVTLDLGEGNNGASVSSNSAFIGGLFTLKGGAGVDGINISPSTLVTAKGITAQLGAGNNSFVLTGSNADIGGPVSVTSLDHAGTATVALNPSQALIIKGGVTINGGLGTNAISLSSAGLVEVNGLVKVVTSTGDDTFALSSSGSVAVKGGLNLALGDGINTVTVTTGSLLTGALTFTGGVGADSCNFNTPSLRTGAITASLGGGNNVLTFNGAEFRASGLVKVITGSGDDSLLLGVSDVRLPKGLLFDAGDGVNVFNAGGLAGVFQSGPLSFLYGEHAAGISSVNFSTATVSINGPLKFTGKSGSDVLNVTGSTFSCGPITAVLGDGTNGMSLNGANASIAGLNFTGGNDVDALQVSFTETKLGSFKASLGGGPNNPLHLLGSRLVVGGTFSITAGAGDDFLTISASHQRFAKGARIDLGDGVNNAQFTAQSILSGSAFTFKAGTHAIGTSRLSLTASSLNLLGLVSATFAGGTNEFTINTASPGRIASVKMLGGPDAEFFQIVNSSEAFKVGAVSVNAGDGDNAASISVFGGSVGAIQYLGGSGQDQLVILPAFTNVASVTANLGAGVFVVSLSGVGQNRFGAVNLQAANVGADTGLVTFSGASFAGPVTAKTGEGDDTINITNVLAAGAFNLSTGKGADTINIEISSLSIPTIFRGPVNISMGDDTDALSIGANTAGDHAEFKSTAKFDGGLGLDTAHVSSTLFANIYLAGQPTLLGFEAAD